MAQLSRRMSERSDEAAQQVAEARALFTDFLISARNRAGCSLDEIALATKIPARHLAALEQGRVDELPRGVYRRAIVRTYAIAIALDPSLVLERFSQVFGADAAFSEWQTVPPPARPRPTAVLRYPSVPVAPGPPTLVSPRFGGATTSPTPTPTPPLSLSAEEDDAPDRMPLLLAAIGVVLVAGFAYVLLPSEDSARPTGSVAPAAAPAPIVGTGATPAAPAATDSVQQASVTLPGSTALQQSASTATSTGEQPGTAAVESRLVVTSNPSGARVTVDGIGWGVTPVTIRHLSPGVKLVRVTKDGYVGQERAVTMGEQGAVAARITLQPRD
jgi:hypothetical protein